MRNPNELLRRKLIDAVLARLQTEPDPAPTADELECIALVYLLNLLDRSPGVLRLTTMPGSPNEAA